MFSGSSIVMPENRRLQQNAEKAERKTRGSPGRTRTCDQPVNSRLLYQLSYRGTRVQLEEAAL
jgi:hypothetical protein